jgi:glucose/arabinose dehydrogenase
MRATNQLKIVTLRHVLIFVPLLALMITSCGMQGQPQPPISTPIPAPTIQPSPTPFPPEIVEQNTPIPLPVDTPGIPDVSMFQWKPVFSGFVKPVDLVSPPGDIAKIMIVEQSGTIQMILNGNTSPIPYLDIRDRVGTSANEQGLLGLAFHPEYAMNRFFFVNYTDLNGDTVIARFTANEDWMAADPSTEVRLLQVDQPYGNHNGGGLAFGDDGYLYIGLGDGGSAGDPQNYAQNLDTLLGKLLRIDVNAQEGYLIPPDNPFTNGGGRPEIWAYGLRNPWRFSFDRATGDLWIGDVGQQNWEEINFLPAGYARGANFGWNILEGSHPYNPDTINPGNLINPIFEYNHDSGCSITGGSVYRGISMLEWQGVYLFGDFCNGNIWGLLNTPSGVEVKPIPKIEGMISSFGVDSSGEVYALEFQQGVIFRLMAK